MTTVENPHSSFTADRIRSEFLSGGDAGAAIANRCTMVDEIVSDAYRSFLGPAFPSGMAVLAVGGYGRRDLFPYSDIDLLLLAGNDLQRDNERQALSAFLRFLWDAGLRVSHSVRTAAECRQFDPRNVELSISLLDTRYLLGDDQVYRALCDALPKFFRAQRNTLLRHLCPLAQARHAKFHATIYHLEPNIKETPGGMRDFHTVQWLSRLRESVEPVDQAALQAYQFLSGVRCKLHFEARRDANVLTFDAQETMAPDPAIWMREYYRNARAIYRAVRREIEISETLAESGLVRSFHDWRSRLSNSDFTVSRDRLFFRSPQRLEHDPELILRTFAFVARHGIALSLEADRRIRESASFLKRHLAGGRAVWPALLGILSQPHVTLAVRAMHDTAVLPTILPAWEQIECLVIRDFYHRYTVDEHTLVTLECLDQLRTTQDPLRKRFGELLAETDQVPLLYMALLCHDTGKSGGLEGHAAASASLAEASLLRIGMPEHDRRVVLFLIRRHLDLSIVMNSRDLGDPVTAADLAARLETLENLKHLTLITYADISAVNPDAMTGWRLEQLWRTYLAGHRELTKELSTERIAAPSGHNASTFLEGFPTRYLRIHTEAEIAAHNRLADAAQQLGVAVSIDRVPGGYQAVVASLDKPFLFASLAGVLSSFGMDIVKAEAFSNSHRQVVDTFTFTDPMRTLELNPAELERLKRTLQRAGLGKEDVRRLLAGRARPRRPKSRGVEPAVAFDAEASESATLVEIIAPDRPGLLFDIASAFSAAGCSIDVVLIDTEAHKAIDVFYVTADGGKLCPELQARLKQELLALCRALQ